MGILKELLEIAEEQETITESKKPAKKAKPKAKRAGKAGDKKHDDGTKLQFKKDRPFAKNPKYPQLVPGNMWFNMVRSGPRSGDLE